MTPTKLLIGQICVCFAIAMLGVWAATQWAAAMLGYQAQLGQPWFVMAGVPVYRPWQLFIWWYHYDAYAPGVFDRAGTLAAGSGFLACGAAVAGSLWRARQTRRVTTYGSSRWATRREIKKAGLFRPAGAVRAMTGEAPAASPPGGSAAAGSATATGPAAPDWAQKLRTEQSGRAARQTAVQTIKDGDRPGAGANPSLDQKDD